MIKKQNTQNEPEFVSIEDWFPRIIYPEKSTRQLILNLSVKKYRDFIAGSTDYPNQFTINGGTNFLKVRKKLTGESSLQAKILPELGIVAVFPASCCIRTAWSFDDKGCA